MAGRKERLDVLLVQQGMFPTREKAQAAILAGHVWVEGRPVSAPGHRVAWGAQVEVRGPACPYVSRGGLKLEGALRAFGLDPKGKVVLDIGASTGGFTDCLLQHGALRVYAVDVGHGQLDWRLRQDPRVVVREGVNARFLSEEHVPEWVDWVTVDVSFISLLKVLPAALGRLKVGGSVLALVKPQFEAGRGQVRKGVVRSAEVWRQVLERVAEGMAGLGLQVLDVAVSPLRGPKGNVEFWLYGVRQEPFGWEAVRAKIPEIVRGL